MQCKKRIALDSLRCASAACVGGVMKPKASVSVACLGYEMAGAVSAYVRSSWLSVAVMVTSSNPLLAKGIFFNFGQ